MAIKPNPSPQPPRIQRYVDGVYGVKCFICFEHKPLPDMKGNRSICKECNYDPEAGCVIAERKYGDYVPVIKKVIKPGPGERQCIGCDGIFPDKEFVTKAGKNSPSCGKCRLAWARSQK